MGPFLRPPILQRKACWGAAQAPEKEAVEHSVYGPIGQKGWEEDTFSRLTSSQISTYRFSGSSHINSGRPHYTSGHVYILGAFGGSLECTTMLMELPLLAHRQHQCKKHFDAFHGIARGGEASVPSHWHELCCAVVPFFGGVLRT